jgi:hypothetical protein
VAGADTKKVEGRGRGRVASVRSLASIYESNNHPQDLSKKLTVQPNKERHAFPVSEGRLIEL